MDDRDRLWAAWREEQARRWRAFADSLTPDQRELLRRYEEACRQVARLRRMESARRRGRPYRGQPVPRPWTEVGGIVRWHDTRWRVARRYRMSEVGRLEAEDRWLVDLEPLEEGWDPYVGVPESEIEEWNDESK